MKFLFLLYSKNYKALEKGWKNKNKDKCNQSKEENFSKKLFFSNAINSTTTSNSSKNARN